MGVYGRTSSFPPMFILVALINSTRSRPTRSHKQVPYRSRTNDDTGRFGSSLRPGTCTMYCHVLSLYARGARTISQDTNSLGFRPAPAALAVSFLLSSSNPVEVVCKTSDAASVQLDQRTRAREHEMNTDGECGQPDSDGSEHVPSMEARRDRSSTRCSGG